MVIDEFVWTFGKLLHNEDFMQLTEKKTGQITWRDELTFTEDWTKVPKCVAEDEFELTNASSTFQGTRFNLTNYEFNEKSC